MRKLIILKSLIDFIWILTCIPLIPLVLFFVITTFTGSSSIDILPWIISSPEYSMTWSLKLSVLLAATIIYVNIYCIYLFRKTLRYFQKAKPFHVNVIKNFGIIGKILCYGGIASIVLSTVFIVYFKSKIKISLGFSPYLFITALGLFFMVLSEVFKIAKHAKEENELTV
ncbi:MAG: DUF2975 domain-containing protein [Bacteroidota bacterium]